MKDKAIAAYSEGVLVWWMVNSVNWLCLFICKHRTVYKGNIGMSIAYFGYAFSNIGLYLIVKQGEKK